MKNYYFFLLLILPVAAVAQHRDSARALLRGQIQPSDDLLASGLFEVSLPRLKRYALTDAEGRFALPGLPFGTYLFIVRGAAQQADTFRIAVDMDTTSLGILPVTMKGMPEQDLTLHDADGITDPVSEQEQGQPVMAAGPAFAVAAQAWNPLGYRYRGYNRDLDVVYLNGLLVQDMETGGTPRVLWAGLTGTAADAGADPVVSQAPGRFSSFTTTAAAKPRRTSLSYSRANGAWSNSIGFSHSTGHRNKGRALSFSAGYNWSRQGYTPGTFYRGFQAALGLSHNLGQHGALHITALVMPVSSGLAAAATQEAMTLAGSHYYNPNWGYQDGQVRNARVARENTPIMLLQYAYKPDTILSLTIAAGCRAGHTGVSGLDWYDAPDPRPDYYKQMPSAFKDDPATAEKIRQEWQNSPERRQLDWNRMYAANRAAGTAQRQRAAYVLGEDRADILQYNFSAAIRKRYKAYTWQAGLSYEQQHTEHYREMLDLLGGDYFVNVNQFAEQAYAGTTVFNQNDLEHPDQEVYTGDPYSYHYRVRQMRATLWSRLVMTYRRMEIFTEGRLAYDAAQREGLYRTGLFAGDSYGKSVRPQFYTFNAAAGIAYKTRGHHLSVRAGAGTTPPAFNDMFVAPRSRNTLSGADLGRYTDAAAEYTVHTRRIQGSVTLFTMYRSGLTTIRRFYHEEYRSFVNYVMNGVSTGHSGLELALSLRAAPFLSVTAAACRMEAVYRSRPEVSIYKDNDTTTRIDRHAAYLRDYRLPGPGALYLLALDFRLPCYIRAGIRWRRAGSNYIDINPARRTDAAVGLTVPGSPEQLRILQQERLPAAHMFDLSAAKTCYFRRGGNTVRHRPVALFLRLAISNVLNNTNAVAGAYEQLRFDFQRLDPDRFPNKYSYARGSVYTFSIALQL